MNCENIQETILTGYLDDQLSPSEKSEVDRHVSSCTACREFIALAQKAAVEPFRQAQRAQLPRETIWRTLKEKIESETAPEAQEAVLPGLWEKLTDIFKAPRPAFVPAAAAVLLLAAAVLTVLNRTGQYAGENRLDEIRSVAYVADEILIDTDDVNGGYDTAIEEYFL